MKSLKSFLLGLAALVAMFTAPAYAARLADATGVIGVAAAPTACLTIDGISYSDTQWFADWPDVTAHYPAITITSGAAGTCCTPAHPYQIGTGACRMTPPACPVRTVTASPCSYTLAATPAGSLSPVAPNTTTPQQYIGSAQAPCDSTGTWGPVSATCQPAPCSPAPVSAYGACSYAPLPPTPDGQAGTSSYNSQTYYGTATSTCSLGRFGPVTETCHEHPPTVALTINGSSTSATVSTPPGVVTFAWTTTASPTSLTIDCGAYGSPPASPPAGGSVSVTLPVSDVGLKTVNCQATVANSAASATSNVVALAAVCPASDPTWDQASATCVPDPGGNLLPPAPIPFTTSTSWIGGQGTGIVNQRLAILQSQMPANAATNADVVQAVQWLALDPSLSPLTSWRMRGSTYQRATFGHVTVQWQVMVRMSHNVPMPTSQWTHIWTLQYN